TFRITTAISIHASEIRLPKRGCCRLALGVSILTLLRQSQQATALIESSPFRVADRVFRCRQERLTMKTLSSILTLLLTSTLVSISFAGSTNAQDPQDQNQATAIMRGYRTGYSDGYQAGVGDSAKSAPREFRNKAEYDHADRAFNSAWGSAEEYRGGYRQGFEVGYNAGYDRKAFDSSIPPDLKTRTEDTSVQY